jgi:hypothetical protein
MLAGLLSQRVDSDAPRPHAGAVQEEMRPLAMPGGPSRFSSIAWPLIGVLVLVAGWTVAISYYFHHQSTRSQFLGEQQVKGARAARVVESTIVADYAAVEQARVRCRNAVTAAALSRAGGEQSIREWAQKSGRHSGVGLIEVRDAKGSLIERTGERGSSASRTARARPASRRARRPRDDQRARSDCRESRSVRSLRSSPTSASSEPSPSNG